jgi:hypothetical protein
MFGALTQKKKRKKERNAYRSTIFGCRPYNITLKCLLLSTQQHFCFTYLTNLTRENLCTKITGLIWQNQAHFANLHTTAI